MIGVQIMTIQILPATQADWDILHEVTNYAI